MLGRIHRLLHGRRPLGVKGVFQVRTGFPWGTQQTGCRSVSFSVNRKSAGRPVGSAAATSENGPASHVRPCTANPQHGARVAESHAEPAPRTTYCETTRVGSTCDRAGLGSAIGHRNPHQDVVGTRPWRIRPARRNSDRPRICRFRSSSNSGSSLAAGDAFSFTSARRETLLADTCRVPSDRSVSACESR